MTERMTAEEALDEASGWLRSFDPQDSDASRLLALGAASAFSEYARAVVDVETALPVEYAGPEGAIDVGLEGALSDATSRIVRAVVTLNEARRRGPRHPAIYQALAILEGDDTEKKGDSPPLTEP